jgi:hypothetical protein
MWWQQAAVAAPKANICLQYWDGSRSASGTTVWARAGVVAMRCDREKSITTRLQAQCRYMRGVETPRTAMVQRAAS